MLMENMINTTRGFVSLKKDCPHSRFICGLVDGGLVSPFETVDRDYLNAIFHHATVTYGGSDQTWYQIGKTVALELS